MTPLERYKKRNAEIERKKKNLTAEELSIINDRLREDIEIARCHASGRIHSSDIELAKEILRLRSSMSAAIDMTDEELTMNEAIARMILYK